MGCLRLQRTEQAAARLEVTRIIAVKAAAKRTADRQGGEGDGSRRRV